MEPTEGGIIRSILFSCALFLAAAAAASQALPGCQDKCGDVSIPYPFGTTRSCYLNENFAITCNKSFSPPVPQLLGNDIVVTYVARGRKRSPFQVSGQLKMLNYVAQDCYDADGRLVTRINSMLWADIFTISNDKNKLTGIGCDTEAIITAEREYIGSGYFTGCISYCDKIETTVDLNGSCSGIRCCQISVPSGLKNLNISVTSFNNHTNVSAFNPCGYAFVTDESKFTSSFKSFEVLATMESLPLVLYWAIGNETCTVVSLNLVMLVNKIVSATILLTGLVISASARMATMGTHIFTMVAKVDIYLMLIGSIYSQRWTNTKMDERP
ncbi:hypothetical protein F3Y22_tig00002511pilonHSYRG00091 [Hibiscus syriacus]|uniref:Wall-associated receptor kinase galacturonan-binding domain-containing protein n=1 Tax=Hibiscus syriacus TaxID=106335 RepID=A0A6A3CWX4_HIBSY|nr:hypothetical protein F3Y22_tig00002511pilonHSYRG00091 [Hibiscus syriacus]